MNYIRIKKVEDNESKLLVFYNEKAILENRSWSLNGFLNHEAFNIQEVTFIQGIDKIHDSFHVWFKKVI